MAGGRAIHQLLRMKLRSQSTVRICLPFALSIYFPGTDIHLFYLSKKKKTFLELSKPIQFEFFFAKKKFLRNLTAMVFKLRKSPQSIQGEKREGYTKINTFASFTTQPIFKSVLLWAKSVGRAAHLHIFWTVWKARNRLTFKDNELSIQRLKYSFILSLGSEAKLIIIFFL